LYGSVLRSFSLVTDLLSSFYHKNIGAKAARKMLMKLTTGVYFIKILQAAILPEDCTAQKLAQKYHQFLERNRW